MEEQELQQQIVEQNEEYGVYICQRCHVKTIDRSENLHSVLCRDCREELIHYPIPKWIYVTMSIVLVAVIISLFYAPSNIKDFRVLRQSRELVENGYVNTGLNQEFELAKKKQLRDDDAVQFVNDSMDYGYYDYAGYTIDNILYGKKLSSDTVSDMNKHIERLAALQETAERIAKETEELTASSSEEDVNIVRERIKSLVSSNYYDNALLYFCLGNNSTDPKERLRYYKKCYVRDPRISYYSVALANQTRRLGDLRESRSILEEAYNFNKEDATIIRSIAVLDMLEGNTKEALSKAEKAYEMSPDGEFVMDTYIVATAENGDVNKAKKMKEDSIKSGKTYDREIDEYLNGSCSLEAYYMDIEEEEK